MRLHSIDVNGAFEANKFVVSGCKQFACIFDRRNLRFWNDENEPVLRQCADRLKSSMKSFEAIETLAQPKNVHGSQTIM